MRARGQGRGAPTARPVQAPGRLCKEGSGAPPAVGIPTWRHVPSSQFTATLCCRPASHGLPSAVSPNDVPPLGVPALVRSDDADGAHDHLFWGRAVEALAGDDEAPSGSAAGAGSRGSIAAFRSPAAGGSPAAAGISAPTSPAPGSTPSSPGSTVGTADVAPRAQALQVELSRPSFGLSTSSQGKSERRRLCRRSPGCPIASLLVSCWSHTRWALHGLQKLRLRLSLPRPPPPPAVSTWRFTMPTALSDKAAVFDQACWGVGT